MRCLSIVLVGFIRAIAIESLQKRSLHNSFRLSIVLWSTWESAQTGWRSITALILLSNILFLCYQILFKKRKKEFCKLCRTRTPTIAAVTIERFSRQIDNFRWNSFEQKKVHIKKWVNVNSFVEAWHGSKMRLSLYRRYLWKCRCLNNTCVAGTEHN